MLIWVEQARAAVGRQIKVELWQQYELAALTDEEGQEMENYCSLFPELILVKL
jgi:hypothetical protein